MAFNTLRHTYVTRVVAFFDQWLLPAVVSEPQHDLGSVPEQAPL